jgi:hypothetical protein
MPRVNQELATIIRFQSDFIDKKRFPTLFIPPCGDRSELNSNPIVPILDEAQKFDVYYVKDGTVTVGITSAASPHTPEMIKNPNQNPKKPEIPAHFIVWAADTSNDNPIAILNIAKTSDEERQRYWQLIAGGIEHAIHILKTSLSEEEEHSIEIYGLGGHISPEERQATGLSRGAQSHPLFHVNVVAHQYQKYRKEAKLEKISPRDFLKQAGPMDTLFMNNFKYDIVTIINNILKQINTPFQTQAEEATGIGKNLVRFYEGISIEFHGLSVEESFETIGKIVCLFASLYDSLRHYFDIYWLSSDQEQTKKEAMIQLELLLGKIDYPQKNDFIERLVEFAFSFSPTHQQLDHWLNQNQILLDENVKKRLLKLKKTYEYIQNMQPANRKKVLALLKGKYGFDDFQAEAYLQFLIDASSPGKNWKSIEYVWSGKLSFSYMLEKYHADENGQIIVEKITLAPRFFTNKGAFEDIGGLRVVRNTGV